MKKQVSALCLLFFLTLSLFSQESSSRVKLINSLADAPGLEQKQEALDSIRAILDGGNAGEDLPGLIRILGNLSSEGTIRVRREKGVVLNDFPEIRLEAVQLLGKTDSLEALPALISVLRNEEKYIILSEAALTAAGLEQADWQALVPYYYRILKLKKDVYYEDQLIRDVLESIRIIYLRDEMIMQDARILDAVIFIAGSELGFTNKTRELAQKLKAENEL